MTGLQLDTPSPASLWLLIPVCFGLLLSVVLGLTTDFLKDCCKKTFSDKKEKEESQSKIDRELVSPDSQPESSSGQKKIRFAEDVLLSKLPPDGREVPFVVPKLKRTYVQPSINWNYEDTVPVWDLRSPKLSSAGLSSSTLDLTSHHRFSSTSSINSTVSSLMDSFGSSRSIDTIFDDLGKLNLKLSYRPDVEQIWITVVQIKDLYLRHKSTEKIRVYLKGTITLPKPVHFKSAVKEAANNLVFLETYVFNIKLPILQRHGLVINIVTQSPRKRVSGECSMSLRELSNVESNVWLDITPPSKTQSCHAILRLGTCFQAVSNRIQLQILEVQNVPNSSTPLALNFYVKIMMESTDGLFDKKKTRLLKAVNGQVKWGETFLFPVVQNSLHLQRISFNVKLYSRSSVRRKHLLGQMVIGWDSSGEAFEQWQDMSANPEKVVIKWHNLNLA